MFFKIIVLFVLQICSICSQEAGIPVTPVDPINNWPRQCYVGIAALPPKVPVPISCPNQYEVFACAYGELRCDGRLFCGTPPCTWRCWCQNPYKRDSNGKCVRICPAIAVDAPIDKCF